MKNRSLLGLVMALLVSVGWLACTPPPQNGSGNTSTTNSFTTTPLPAAQAINTTDLMNHIKQLASDEFEGRGPASPGEEATVKYLSDTFKGLGLKPGNPDGSYTQKVPLVNFKVEPDAEMVFSKAGKDAKLKFRDDFVAWTRHLVEEAQLDADLVFVGYGAVAPEYQWDDFKDVDVKGKVVVMLINDPPLPDVFGGKAMTYYGRWTYKYEIAAKKGAAGCIIIHETEPASYPWEVVRNSWGDGGFTFEGPNGNKDTFCAVESWITVDKAKELFAMAGQDFEAAKKAALTREFKPLDLGVKAQLTLKNSFTKIESQNVIAKLEGSDPQLKNEYVIFTAHWDHFGVGSPVNDDKIYNGARDNASGTAGLLELAKAFTKMEKAPRRSLLFLAVTAEERGLLGSAYYGQNPLYPLARTAAVINMDSLNVWGRTKDVTVVGLGISNMDDYAKNAAKLQGREVKPDPEPQRGAFYRSDHFSFAKQGVPALDPGAGVDFVGKSAEFSKQVREKYNSDDYHKPSDEIKPDWDLSGAVEDLQLLFYVGHDVANADKMPEWNAGAEFKPIRDRSLKEAGAK
jgi:Zn-dependent M28 family amino/carboxypeptidase